ncbi:hypothetical protein EYF80_012227 [Liparis tanakae]|uniref:Uncharacterized protein n=1 Tax=Liparis tanakae TaxID=230148 RepID=A0A4Z2IIL7_9TELE|nr:hypothetical protein EYF80_012227 [Liparis tanakae]
MFKSDVKFFFAFKPATPIPHSRLLPVQLKCCLTVFGASVDRSNGAQLFLKKEKSLLSRSEMR